MASEKLRPHRCTGRAVGAVGAVALSACALAGAQAPSAADDRPAAPEPAAAGEDRGVALPRVTVTGRRPVDIGPQRGLRLRKEQIPGNIQAASGQAIEQSGAISLTDFMNASLLSVSISNYAGNPFQADVNYRGFSASPQLGAPQGLSVFLDGVRMNEPFGDVVNWDLIPLNAIAGLTLVPGSNPLYGLNTLGGAIDIRTKNGFDETGVSSTILGGSWGRVQWQIAGGGHDGPLAVFAAMTLFHEDGWRDHSPSDLAQGFAKLSYRDGPTDLDASLLLVGNRLVGNGLIPQDLYAKRPQSVFTSPDQTRNRLWQLQLDGRFDLGDGVRITAQVHHRASRRRSVAGDVFQDFERLSANGTGDRDLVITGRQYTRQDPLTGQPVNGGPVCAYQDVNRDGFADYATSLALRVDPGTGRLVPDAGSVNGDLREIYERNYAQIQATAALYGLSQPGQPMSYASFVDTETNGGLVFVLPPINVGPRGQAGVDCAGVTYQYGRGRNGAHTVDGTGVVEGTPIGVITRSDLEQAGSGAAVQVNLDLERHALMIGAGIERSTASYLNTQQLALIDAQHQVFADPANIAPVYDAAANPVPVNRFAGSSRTWSAYASETWSPSAAFHVTLSGRYNRTEVKNDLRVRATLDAHLASFRNRSASTPDIIVCPSRDPASCPSEPNGSIQASGLALTGVDPFALGGTAERFVYENFNPSLGFTVQATPWLNMFANWSRGARAPSVIELGCAFDPTPVWFDSRTGEYVTQPTLDDNGNPTIPRARSLASINGSCALPSVLSGDPFLQQIRAGTIELGVRGSLGDGWEWSASMYRTSLQDDIYFISVTPERSYFGNVGATRRQGFELGIGGSHGPFEIAFNYGYNEATFRDDFWIASAQSNGANLDPEVLTDLGYSALGIRPGAPWCAPPGPAAAQPERPARRAARQPLARRPDDDRPFGRCGARQREQHAPGRVLRLRHRQPAAALRRNAGRAGRLRMEPGPHPGLCRLPPAQPLRTGRRPRPVRAGRQPVRPAVRDRRPPRLESVRGRGPRRQRPERLELQLCGVGPGHVRRPRRPARALDRRGLPLLSAPGPVLLPARSCGMPPLGASGHTA